MFKVGCQELKNNQGSIGTLGKSHKPYETTEKMKMTKQATSYIFSYPIRLEDQYCGDIAILPQNEVDYDTND